jgi:Na+/proline symporter
VVETLQRGGAETNDTNYIVLSFVMKYLPAGLVGLILSVVFAASMSSNSAAMRALASTRVIDVYLRVFKKTKTPDESCVRVGKLATVFWGLIAILFAEFANRLGTLIEVVNILGSLIYPTILGIFILAFLFPRVTSTAAFVGALVGEAAVLAAWLASDLAFLWYNVLGCAVVVLVALALNPWVRGAPTSSPPSSPGPAS